MSLKKKIASIIFVALTAMASTVAEAQIAIKNNLIYDVNRTPNLGVEIGLSPKTTAQVFYGINPWKYSDDKQMRHWVVMPEYRWWTCSRFNGHFFGIHAMGGEFNVQNMKDTFGLIKEDIEHRRYEGWFIGGGITYGYQWILNKHWNIEASVGFGYDYIQYKEYECGECGAFTTKDHSNYVGPTKLALSMLYLF
ncbi:MAG: DUF3575 domain-containing protein [Prevotellaceae bacterium]|nr:DUF3575 domain-containing protein [Candidatus Colivivens caballi]